MGKIIVSDNVSLDGVVQDPTGEEGFKFGGWVGLLKDREELNNLTLHEMERAEALLLGRRSYQFFAARWPSRSGALANRMNSIAKYVVSSTLEDPTWNNTKVLKGDAMAEVSRLKKAQAGNIVVLASFHLVHMLMEHDLVDELWLKIFPIVLGAGERLFAESSDKRPMCLVDSRIVDHSIAHLTYERERDG